MWLFYYFNFERNNDVSKLKSPCILLNKNINFDKKKNNRIKNVKSHTQFSRGEPCASAHKIISI